MRNWFVVVLVAVAPLMAVAAEAPPDWAYPETPVGFQRPPEDGKLVTVAGSTKSYADKDTHDPHDPPDWFPDEHPPLPSIVGHGKEGVTACTLCHMANGHGHPESASLAGLPAAYIEEQLHAFKNGDRRSMRAGRSDQMIGFAKAMTDAEIKEAAAYFSANKPAVRQKVIETANAPKTYVGAATIRFVSPGGQTEPMGQRIIQVPENPDEAKVHSARSMFLAYVPVGSIKAGETIATTGGGKTLPCTACHGPDFKGIGNIPPLAGRPAIYIFRQLNDIQKGTRNGNSVAPMKAVVAKLSEDDMIALSAYMASREP